VKAVRAAVQAEQYRLPGERNERDEGLPSDFPPYVEWTDTVDAARLQIRRLTASIDETDTLWQLTPRQREVLIGALTALVDEVEADIPRLSDEAAAESLAAWKAVAYAEAAGVDE
jgi:hypothetical protein